MDARFLVFVVSSVLVSDYASDVSSQIMVTSKEMYKGEGKVDQQTTIV